MRDQEEEKQFDAEVYKKNLLSKSHGRVRRASAQAVVAAYMPDKEEIDKIRSEEKARISRRFDPKNYTRM